jgi:hypothetical protein
MEVGVRLKPTRATNDEVGTAAEDSFALLSRLDGELLDGCVFGYLQALEQGGMCVLGLHAEGQDEEIGRRAPMPFGQEI